MAITRHGETLGFYIPAQKHSRTAELEAMRGGCNYMQLETFSFGARGFYEKQGYVVFGVQEDFPPGHRRFYLRKKLSPE